MNTNHTAEDLSRAETYAADPDLAALARRLATSNFEALGRGRVAMGELKREFTSGQHADLVAAELEKLAAAGTAAKKKAEKGTASASTIVPPAGYRILTEGTQIIISGPFDDDLHTRIKRAGGRWDGATGTNRKVWMLPAEKGGSLKRIFANWTPKAAAKFVDADRVKAVRWLGYVEEKAPGYLYQSGIDTLRALRIERWPELQARLDAAIAACTEAAAQKAHAARPITRDQALERDQQVQRVNRRHLVLCAHLPPMNTPVMLAGRLVVFTGTGQAFRIDENAPSIHGSHLLGHEGERGCYAYYRLANDLETAQYQAHAEQVAARAADRAAAGTEIQHLVERAQREGTRPAEIQVIEGERLMDTQTLYGGGDWWVIQAARVWYIRNNGADGDDWSRNNILTGGAGAIGWYLPADPALIATLRRLAALLA